YTGVTTVNAGVLQLSKDNLISGAIPAGLTVVEGEVRLLLNNQIADNATVNLSGRAALLNLNGHSDTIGALNMRGATVVTQTGFLTVNGNVTAQTVNGVGSMIVGHLVLGSSTGTITVIPQVGTVTSDLVIDGTVGGSSVLVKEGTGVMELKGSDSYHIDEVDVNAGSVFF